MFGGSGLDCEMLFYEAVTKPTVQRIRTKFEFAHKTELERIVSNYDSLPLYKRVLRRVCFEAPWCFEKNLEYIFARDLLNGTFSWEQADKKQRKKEQEREKEIQEARQREEWSKKGKSIDLFMGSLEEYERLKDQKYKIVDVKDPVVYHPCDSKTHLVLGKLGVEALIRFKQNSYNDGGVGIPVRKKN